MNYSEAPGSLNAVTTATYADFESLWNRYPENAWEEAHPGVDASEMNQKMLGHRLMTGSTIYRLVDKVEASN